MTSLVCRTSEETIQMNSFTKQTLGTNVWFPAGVGWEEGQLGENGYMYIYG